MCTTLQRSWCRFTVTVRTEFDNQASLTTAAFQTMVGGWDTAIGEMWNGPVGHQHFRCCTVVFEAVTRVGTDTADFHQIDVVDGPQTSFVSGLGPACRSGRWDAQDTGTVVAHETGHLLGLPDEYDYNGPGGSYQNLNPQPSDPQSIMAQTWGSVAALQEHIDAICTGLGASCRWWCRIFCFFHLIWDWLQGRLSLRVLTSTLSHMREPPKPPPPAAPDEDLAELSVEQILERVEAGLPQTLARAAHELQLRGGENVPALTEGLTREHPLVRWVAASVLGRLRAEGARPALQQALGDDHVAVRVAAAEALLKLGDRDGLPTLMEELESDQVMVGHPPVLVRDHVVQVLEAATGRHLGADPGAWRAWWEEESK